MTTKLSLDAVHLVNEGVYLLERCQSHQLVVGGINIPQYTQRIVAPGEDDVKVLAKGKPVLDGYRDATSEATISKDAYHRQLQTFELPDEDGNYTSLDAEFDHRRFESTWIPVYKTQDDQLVDVVFNVTEIRTESGDADIKSLWNSARVGTQRCLYSLDTHHVIMRTVSDLCTKHSIPWENGSSGLTYIKIAGAYVATSAPEASDRAREFIGTLDQCVTKKQQLIETATQWVAIGKMRREASITRDAVAILSATQEAIRALTGGRPVKAELTQRALTHLRIIEKALEQQALDELNHTA